MPFSILDRYLMREIVISWAGVTAVLFFIMLALQMNWLRKQSV